MSYPANFLRGIRSEADFRGDGRVWETAFEFDPNDDRDDGFLESSVNWEDNSSVIDFTLNQKKGDSEEYEFKAGCAVISLEKLSKILEREIESGMFSYERRPLAGNPHHGNLLMEASVARNKREKRWITTGIAFAVVDTRRR